jgi:hypothetical protein
MAVEREADRQRMEAMVAERETEQRRFFSTCKVLGPIWVYPCHLGNLFHLRLLLHLLL